MSQSIRLNKFISDTGFCSRREADTLIDDGRVMLNGRHAEMGARVSDGDDVRIDGRSLRKKPPTIYLACNKPAGITCTTERQVKGNIIDFIGHPQRIFPIGRLDKPSQGLIFLTNDGDIVNKILRAGNSHDKEYLVSVDKTISPVFMQQMAQGVNILDTVTLPCRISQTGPRSFRIVLTQGLNRQIRRMCEALGYEVQTLKRVRIMNITLEGIDEGKWRYLTKTEMAELNALVADSSTTEEASALAVPVAARPRSARPPGTARKSAPSQARAAGGGAAQGKPGAGAPGRSPGKSSGKPPGKSSGKAVGKPAGKAAGKSSGKPAGKSRPANAGAGRERPEGGRRSRGR